MNKVLYIPCWSPVLLLSILNIFSFLNKTTLEICKNSLMLLLVVFFIGIIKKAGIVSNKYTYIIVVTLLCGILFPFGEKGIGSIFNLILLCTCFLVFGEYYWHEYEIKIIGLCCGVINFIYFLKTTDYTLNYYSDYYTIGASDLINPNILGLFLLYSCILSCISAQCLSHKFKKNIMSYGICLITIISLFRLGCRGSLMALIFFVVMSYCVPQKIRNTKMLLNIFIFTICFSFFCSTYLFKTIFFKLFC